MLLFNLVLQAMNAKDMNYGVFGLDDVLYEGGEDGIGNFNAIKYLSLIAWFA